MTWTDLTTHLTSHISRFKARFPHVDENELRHARDPEKLIDHVARRHDLTRLEALQEIDDWMFIEGLARQAAEFARR